MSSNQTIKVFGEEYTISADEIEYAYLKKVAKYVDLKMKELSKAVSDGNAKKVAILAALNIADEMFQMQEMDIDSTLTAYEEKARKLIAMLDDGLVEKKY
ncbi:MAG: cell division protein ZapA [Leptospiraceae bacterium]|nr:cell division protein ZapA [Leptospiraceae bacterium]MCP5497685.1 cell division protein ZapA [Leptospiraceae bacterium]